MKSGLTLGNTRLSALHSSQFVRVKGASKVAKGVKTRGHFFRLCIFSWELPWIAVYFATVSARDSATASC